jgi:hypothetical protein
VSDHFIDILFEDVQAPEGVEEFDMRGIYMSFTVVDAVYGSLQFRIGDTSFSAGSDRIYPAITSWGALRSFMSLGGASRESETEIEMISDAVVTTNNGNSVFTIHQIVRDFPLHNVAVDIKQWIEETQTTVLIWSGFVRGIGQMRHETIGTVSLTIASSSSDAGDSVSDVITSSPAPVDSIGKMVPRVYGNFGSKVSTAEPVQGQASICLGFGDRFIQGVVVDEQQSDLKVKVRFAKNDGTKSALGFNFFSFAVYIPETNSYAFLSLDDGYNTLINDVNEVAIITRVSPEIAVAHKLSDKGTQLSTAFEADAWKMFDADPSNYIETDSTDFDIGIEIPPLSISGFTVSSITPFLYVTCPVASPGRTIEAGIWNRSENPTGGWLNGQRETGITVHSTLPYIAALSSTGTYDALDFQDHVGADTHNEFSQGTFIGRDAVNNATPVEVAVKVTSASKDQVIRHRREVHRLEDGG